MHSPAHLKGLQPYCFADYKEEAIELLQKVCTVFIETMKIVREIKTYPKLSDYLL